MELIGFAGEQRDFVALQSIQHTASSQDSQEDAVGTHTSGVGRWSVPVRLAAMMFLQYFALGAWIVPLTRYLQTPPGDGGLGFAPSQVGFIYMTFAFGALIAPLVIGLLADRWFAVERVIAATNAAMAVLMGVAAWWCDKHDGTAAAPSIVVGPLFVILLGYAVGCQITLTLSNVISFRNLDDRGGVFWYVRLIGTFGWIISGMVVGWGLRPISPQPLFVAAGASALTAVFSLFLPHTPPKGYGRPIAEVVGLPAIKLLRDRSFVTFAFVLFLANLMNQFYTLFTGPYLHALGVRTPELVMTLAQWCEVACMAATPWLLQRLGLKRLMILGMAGYVMRNALLYSGSMPWAVVLGLPMHGWSYAFYGMVGAHFVDREAPPHLRAGAQALVTFLANGPAVLAGNFLAGRVVEAHQNAGVTDWPDIWLVPLIGYIVAFCIFIALFREPPSPEIRSQRSEVGR
jgi:nucleoside transporter